jgi:hypothetical protein
MASDLIRFKHGFNPLTRGEFEDDILALVGLMQEESSNWLNLLVSGELNAEA